MASAPRTAAEPTGGAGPRWGTLFAPCTARIARSRKSPRRTLSTTTGGRKACAGAGTARRGTSRQCTGLRPTGRSTTRASLRRVGEAPMGASNGASEPLRRPSRCRRGIAHDGAAPSRIRLRAPNAPGGSMSPTRSPMPSLSTYTASAFSPNTSSTCHRRRRRPPLPSLPSDAASSASSPAASASAAVCTPAMRAPAAAARGPHHAGARTPTSHAAIASASSTSDVPAVNRW